MTATRHAAMAAMLLSLGVSGADAQTDSHDCVIQPREIVELSTGIQGVLIDRPVKRGDIVAAGQVVAQLEDSRERLALDRARMAAERDVEVQSRQVAAQFRAAELARIEDLAARNLTPAIEAERARLELSLAEYAIDAARMDQAFARAALQEAEADLARRTIKSPVDGVVTLTSAAPGDFVSATTPVLTLAKLDVLNVEVFLPTDLYGVPVLGGAAVVVPEDPIGGTFEAVIETIDQVFDAASGTFGVRLTLDNPDYALPAGLRCTVTFAAN